MTYDFNVTENPTEHMNETLPNLNLKTKRRS